MFNVCPIIFFKSNIFLFFVFCLGFGDSNTTYHIVIAILGALLLLTVGVIIYLKRRLSVSLQDRQQTNNTEEPKENSNSYDNIAYAEENHKYSTLDSVTLESNYQNN